MNISTNPDLISRAASNVTPDYMSGFGNSFETEALPGALPIGRTSPHSQFGRSANAMVVPRRYRWPILAEGSAKLNTE